jgi:hypothetical protein
MQKAKRDLSDTHSVREASEAYILKHSPEGQNTPCLKSGENTMEYENCSLCGLEHNDANKKYFNAPVEFMCYSCYSECEQHIALASKMIQVTEKKDFPF